jgi:dipeptidyl aminopeptidase/acylaminoacyl peptidase
MTGNWWDPTILALVRAGFHVFAPNFRGSTGFGTEFKQLNIGDLGGGDLQDVQYGAKYAAACLGRDDQPAILGASYGGYLVLQALTTQPDAWAGGVAIAATADWTDEYRRSDAHFRFYAEYFFGGTPDERPELYHDRSPINHVHRLKAPLLVIHGEHDSNCPIEPVRRFVDLARQHDLPVRLVVTQDEGHGTSQNANAIRDTILALEHLRLVFA